MRTARRPADRHTDLEHIQVTSECDIEARVGVLSAFRAHCTPTSHAAAATACTHTHTRALPRTHTSQDYRRRYKLDPLLKPEGAVEELKRSRATVRACVRVRILCVCACACVRVHIPFRECVQPHTAVTSTTRSIKRAPNTRT